MSLKLYLSKLKALFPVFVVGASVAITIKLLTESSPTTSNIFQVSATEDILEASYEDKLEVPPEPEPEQQPPAQEDTPPQEQPEPKDEKEGDEKTEEEDDKSKSEDQNSEQKDQTDQKQQENKKKQKPAAKRRFIPTGIGGLLGKIFNTEKQN